MTRAPSVSQHSRAYYFVPAGVLLLLGCMLTWGAVAGDNASPLWRLARFAIAVAFFLGALRRIERLVHPENARRRSRRLADAMPRGIGFVRAILTAITVLGTLAGGIMILTKTGDGPGVILLSLVCSEAASALADFSGEPEFPIVGRSQA